MFGGCLYLSVCVAHLHFEVYPDRHWIIWDETWYGHSLAPVIECILLLGCMKAVCLYTRLCPHVHTVDVGRDLFHDSDTAALTLSFSRTLYRNHYSALLLLSLLSLLTVCRRWASSRLTVPFPFVNLQWDDSRRKRELGWSQDSIDMSYEDRLKDSLQPRKKEGKEGTW